MRRASITATFIFCAALLVFFDGKGISAGPNLPLVKGKPVLAMVNKEPVTLEEFDRVLSSLHTGMTDNTAKPRSNPSELLDRLINGKLILQEARNIGLDELPEVTDAAEAYGKDLLRGMLFSYHIRNVRKADRKEVEKLYEASIKEVKLQSVLLRKEEDGREMESEVKAGGDYLGSAKKMMDSKKAVGSLEGQYVKVESLNPKVVEALATMKKGDVSPLIRIGENFTMLKLEDMRSLNDPSLREKAEKNALQAKRLDMLEKYAESLKKKYVKVNRKLFDGLNYDSGSAEFEERLEDTRVLAEVKGEKPVTVGELSKVLKQKFYHGAETAAKRQKLNIRKEATMSEILVKRVAVLEAKRKKFDRSKTYKDSMVEYRKNILFGAFVRNVVDPSIHVEEADSKSYLQDHIRDYTTPEIMRIDGLVFARKADAEGAIEKLRKGVDFLWVKEHAEGQIDPADKGNSLEFKGDLLTLDTLPEGVKKSLYGARAGEYRLHVTGDAPSYVLFVREVIPPQPLPFESVKEQIGKKIFEEKRLKAMREWEEKLRAVSDVKVFASGETLDRIVKPAAK